MKIRLKGRKLSFILTSAILLIVAGSLFFFDVRLGAARAKNDSDGASLELSGKILDDYASSEKVYSVELMLGDQRAGSLRVRNTESFSLKLYRDRHYLLNITGSKGSSKVISVYTHLPVNDDQLYRFSFITSLQSTQRFGYPSVPAALIAYDHQLRDFCYSEEIPSQFTRRLYSQKASGGFNY